MEEWRLFWNCHWWMCNYSLFAGPAIIGRSNWLWTARDVQPMKKEFDGQCMESCIVQRSALYCWVVSFWTKVSDYFAMLRSRYFEGCNSWGHFIDSSRWRVSVAAGQILVVTKCHCIFRKVYILAWGMLCMGKWIFLCANKCCELPAPPPMYNNWDIFW